MTLLPPRRNSEDTQWLPAWVPATTALDPISNNTYYLGCSLVGFILGLPAAHL
jgi:hypothetical protein